MVSLATFSLNLALARFATPEVYGQFVIAFSLLLLAYACVQVPLALEPLIFLEGKKTNTQDQAIYVRHSFVLTVAVGLVCVGLLLTIGVCFEALQNPIYAKACWMASLPLLFMNVRYFIRCFYIMKGSFYQAFLYDFSVLLIIGGGLAALVWFDRINDWAIVGLFAVAEATASMVWFARRRRCIPRLVLDLASEIETRPPSGGCFQFLLGSSGS